MTVCRMIDQGSDVTKVCSASWVQVRLLRLLPRMLPHVQLDMLQSLSFFTEQKSLGLYLLREIALAMRHPLPRSVTSFRQKKIEKKKEKERKKKNDDNDDDYRVRMKVATVAAAMPPSFTSPDLQELRSAEMVSLVRYLLSKDASESYRIDARTSIFESLSSTTDVVDSLHARVVCWDVSTYWMVRAGISVVGGHVDGIRVGAMCTDSTGTERVVVAERRTESGVLRLDVAEFRRHHQEEEENFLEEEVPMEMMEVDACQVETWKQSSTTVAYDLDSRTMSSFANALVEEEDVASLSMNVPLSLLRCSVAIALEVRCHTFFCCFFIWCCMERGDGERKKRKKDE